MAQPGETMTVGAALSAYASVGPEYFIGDLPPEAEAWQQAAEGQELTPNEMLRFAWLAIERGFHELHVVDRLRDQARGGGRSKGEMAPSVAGGGSRKAKGHDLMMQAQ